MVPESIKSLLPYFACGTVVQGFGRGSKQLGCPTANLPSSVVSRLPPGFQCGVYYGWASVNSGRVHEMVMSIGYNPHFGNKRKTMETHIMHEYAEDFYGSLLKIAVVGFIRDMTSFKNLDELIEAIESDKRYALKQLQTCPQHSKIREHEFFTAGSENEASPTDFASPNIEDGVLDPSIRDGVIVEPHLDNFYKSNPVEMEDERSHGLTNNCGSGFDVGSDSVIKSIEKRL